MRKNIERILCVVLIICSILAISSCNNENHSGTGGANLTNEQIIRNRINEFLTAYNAGDMDAVLDCLDSKSRNAMSAMLDLLGGLAGSQIGFDIDLRDLFSLGIYIESDDFMKLRITDITPVDHTHATATATMDLTGYGTETIFFHMLYENEDWYISDISDKKGGVNNENNSDDSINITKLNSADTVVYTMNNREYAGVINADGEIFYSVEGDSISWRPVGNGSGYVTYTRNSKTVYDIVNQEGTVVASFEEGTDIDEIIGYGGGLILVYKNTSSISKESHSYGVIDSKTGDWYKPLREGAKLPNPNTFHNSVYEYVGYGTFLKYYYSGNTEHYVLYNSISNMAYYLDNCVLSLVNGALYGQNVGGWLTSGTICCADDPDTYADLPKYFALYHNGAYEEIGEFVMAEGNMIIGLDETEEYYSIKNKVTNTSVIYDDFKIDRIDTVEIIDDHVLFGIHGADGKYYSVLIDDSGNACFEPIAVASTYVAVSGDRMKYKASGSDYFTLMDLDGNIVVPEDQKYISMTFVADGHLIYAKNSVDEVCLLDRNGNPVVIKLGSK